ncbi:MAG: PIN domain-containing protein [Acidobacteria bacterium ACB1]|nr:hypothetical protein [Pyrinomonadaceae bacterium]MCE7963007.1 PIN domain-containing protein [Acidobacteria bacterium ACB1]RIJ96252.1 MAG: PIN domain-containing protein [Acidobacteriota bacterium]
MHAVDTNVLIRLLVRDNPKQTASAERYIENGAWVSLLVLIESLCVLDSYYEKTRAEIAKAVHLLLNHASLVIQDPETVASALQSFNEVKGVSFSDCLIIAVAHKAGHRPLGTFDAKLAKVDGAVLL